MTTSTVQKQEWRVSGRFVLLCLIGFFGVIFAVNAALVRFATSTFGGVEVAGAYQAGLKFNDDIAAARRQDALLWRVEGKLNRLPSHQIQLDLSVATTDKTPIESIDLEAKLVHPADNRQDRSIEMNKVGAGHFRGVLPAEDGQWELTLDLSKQGERKFRSVSRINLAR